MAVMACSSSSMVFPSTSTPLKKTPSLGFSFRSLSRAVVSSALATKKKSFAMKCTQETQDLSLVLKKERWMFDVTSSAAQYSEVGGDRYSQVNAEKVAVFGKKRTQKLYKRNSRRPGGMTMETFDQLQKRIPERIIEHAVRGMLPKGKIGRHLFNHLKMYKGADHPHQAQKPISLPLSNKRIEET